MTKREPCKACAKLRAQLADVTAQRDQANRNSSDALSRAERAETEAGDLRAQCSRQEHGFARRESALQGTLVDEQRAHAKTRETWARYVIAQWRLAGDEGFRGMLDEFLAFSGLPAPIAELARREAAK